MKDIAVLAELSEKAYRSMDFDRAILLLDEIIERSPESPEGLSSRHLRAMAYEFGNSSQGRDLAQALKDYEFLVECSALVGSIGQVGAARVLLDLNVQSNMGRAKGLCLDAVALDGSRAAKMLLGYIANELEGDTRTARKWFFSAFRDGSPWGIRYLAASFWKEGKYIRGAMFHFLSAISWPILARGGNTKSPYH